MGLRPGFSILPAVSPGESYQASLCCFLLQKVGLITVPIICGCYEYLWVTSVKSLPWGLPGTWKALSEHYL